MEQTKKIKEFSHYKVTSMGRIWSDKTNQWLKPRNHIDGYLNVCLYKKDRVQGYERTIHRLVLETFRGKKPKGKECRHLNGIKTDNRLENLRWGTPQQNGQDRSVHLKQTKQRRKEFNEKVWDRILNKNLGITK